MTNNIPLRSAIHRILIRRLSVTVLVVSILFAAISYYHTRDMITNAIIQASTSQMDVIRGRFKELMGRPGMNMKDALQDAVNYPPDTELHIKEGEFVYALLHNKDRRQIGIYEHKNYPDLTAAKEYLAKIPKMYPEYGKLEYKSIFINGKQYLDIHSRLLRKNGGPPIFLRAIFALSEQTTDSVHRQALKTVLNVIALVLATALLIYPVIKRLTDKLSGFSSSLLTAHLETMQALGAAIAKRDHATNAHNYRVTIYAAKLAEELGMDEQQMPHLIKGAFLHDVGKIGIRDNILLTKARLDAGEFEIMQQHVGHGLDIIKRSSWLKDAKDVVGCHHEKYDGSGYPAGLKGLEIPLNARIFAIADVFDALTSRRPYKEPFPYQEAMQIMADGRTTHFDPDLLDRFTNIAQSLYNTYSGCEDHSLETELQKITDQYFQSGIQSLRY